MREIDTDQLAGSLNSDATLVDVREPREFADGHVPGGTTAWTRSGRPTHK